MGIRRFFLSVLLMLLIPGMWHPGRIWCATPDGRMGAILEGIRRFEALGSRITGTDGCNRAADIIAQRFVQLGLRNVVRQPFTVVVPVTRHVRLAVDGVEIPAHPLWPNDVRTATIDGAIRGPLIWAEQGILDAYNGHDVTGSIVVLEGDLGVDWFYAPMLGARAVIFVESDNATRPQMEYKFSSVPIPTPRFWLDRTAGAVLKQMIRQADAAGRQAQADLTCRVDWEERQGHNIFGLLPGADPAESANVMVVEAYYDAVSAVPDLAPGAENAVNAALLLRLAEEFAVRPPARPVLFAAFAGHYQALRGARIFADLWRHTSGGRAPEADPRERTLAEIQDLEGLTVDMATMYRELATQLDALRSAAADLPEDMPELARNLARDALTPASPAPALGRIREAVLSIRSDRGALMRTDPKSTIEVHTRAYEAAGRVRDFLDAIDVRESKAGAARSKLFRLKAHMDFAGQLGPDLLSRIRFLYALDLSSHGESLGFFYKAYFVDQHERGYETKIRQVTSPLAYRATGLADAMAGSGALVDGVNNPAGLTWKTHLPVPLAVDLEMPLLAGLPGAAFLSTGDPRIWIDTPLDRPDRMDMDGLGKQIDLLVPLLRALLSDPQALRLYDEIDREALLSREHFHRVYGRTVAYDPTRSLGDMADQPVGGALLTLQRNPGLVMRPRGLLYKTCGGVRVTDMAFANAGGFFEFIGVWDRQSAGWQMDAVRLEGYVLRPESGDIRYAPDRSGQGAQYKQEQSDFTLTGRQPETLKNPVLFECEPVTVFEMMDQRSFSTFVSLDIYNARTGSTPMASGSKLVGTLGSTTYVEPVAVLFVPPGMRFKAMFSGTEPSLVIGGTPVAGMKYPLLNITGAPGDPPDGIGYAVPHGGILTLTPLRMAEDIWRLNEDRLDRLRKHGVRSTHSEGLHAAAAAGLKQARSALAEKRYDAFLRHTHAAWSFEAKAYPHVRGATADVLAGMFLYLFLLLPFAHFTERLLFGFTNINAQIAGFFGIFLVAFLILSRVHPAFALTNAAPVILLAFVTVTLSIMVIAMVRSRFQLEISRLQRRPGAGKRGDFSRLDAAKTAFILGINNMRRRKLRTGLTVTTLILLMFSILSLSSIESRLMVQRRAVAEGEKPRYEGVLLHNGQWADLPAHAYGSLLNALPPEEGHIVVPRNWIVSQDVNVPTGVVLSGAERPERTFRLTGLVGMVPEEARVTRPQNLLASGRWMRPGEKHVCIVSGKIAAQLGLAGVGSAEPPEVMVYGRRLKVIGLFDDEKLLQWKDIDTEPLSPVDYSVENWQRHGGTDRSQDVKLYQYTHLDPRNVLFAPYELLLDHDATLRSIAVIPAPDRELREFAEREILKKLDIPVFLAQGVRVTYASSVKGDAVSGVAALFIPMLISALIVFNTMLGSVYEREREISIYGAMGLAPVHISSLFVAESCVYATVSTVAGYIVGQVVAKVITQRGLLAGLSLNYSSTSAVFAAVFIAAVVLLSTLYPARRAAALSVPDVERIWKLPKPEGDLLDIEFPFTIGKVDAAGINAYLLYDFREHSRQSVGEFYAVGNRLSAEDTPEGMRYLLCSDIWISPFDFGISQRLEMETAPTGDRDICQTRMTLTRKSGENDAWVKMNNRFLKHIRKQFLLWRLLTPQERDFYRVEAAKAQAQPQWPGPERDRTT